MAFTEAERVKIRRYLGASRLFLSSDPRLESAITTIQSIADGGSAPDSSTEDDVRAALTTLATIDTYLDECAELAMAAEDEGTRVDYGYRMGIACKRGRMLVGLISDALEYRPLRDVFSAPKLAIGGDARFRE